MNLNTFLQKGSVGFDRLSKGSMAQNRLRNLVLYFWRLNSFVTSKPENSTDKKLRNLTYLFIVQNLLKLAQASIENLEIIIFPFAVLNHSPFLVIFVYNLTWLKQCHWNYCSWVSISPISARPVLGGYRSDATTAPYNFHSKLCFL